MEEEQQPDLQCCFNNTSWTENLGTSQSSWDRETTWVIQGEPSSPHGCPPKRVRVTQGQRTETGLWGEAESEGTETEQQGTQQPHPRAG